MRPGSGYAVTDKMRPRRRLPLVTLPNPSEGLKTGRPVPTLPNPNVPLRRPNPRLSNLIYEGVVPTLNDVLDVLMILAFVVFALCLGAISLIAFGSAISHLAHSVMLGI